MLYVKVTNPENGYKSDQVAAELLIRNYGKDAVLDVQQVNIGRSSSDVKLKVNSHRYNSVNFTFYTATENGLIEYDIFKNPLKIASIKLDYINMWPQ